MELEDNLKLYGLGKRWIWLLKSLGIETVSDLQTKLQTPEFQNAMHHNVRPSEVEKITRFLEQSSMSPESRGASGALTQLLERDKGISQTQADDQYQRDLREPPEPEQFLRKGKKYSNEKDKDFLQKKDKSPSEEDNIKKIDDKQILKPEGGEEAQAVGGSVTCLFEKLFQENRASNYSQDGVTVEFDRLANRDSTLQLLKDENLTMEFNKLLEPNREVMETKEPSQVTSESEKHFLEDKTYEKLSTERKESHREEVQSFRSGHDTKPLDSVFSTGSVRPKDIYPGQKSAKPENPRDLLNVPKDYGDAVRSRDMKYSLKHEEKVGIDGSINQEDSYTCEESVVFMESEDQNNTSKYLERVNLPVILVDPVESLESVVTGDEHIVLKQPEDLPSNRQVHSEDIAEEKSPRKNNSTQCLEYFLQNIGIDWQLWGNKFISEGIYTLEDLQNCYIQRNHFSRLAENIGIDKGHFQEVLGYHLHDAVEHELLLNKLDIIQYFPEKITLQITMEKCADNLESLSDVPWHFLSKILMLDHRVRDDLLPENVEKALGSAKSDSVQDNMLIDDILDDMFSKLSDKSSEGFYTNGPHPLDALVAIFQCSSNFLRQIICEKMSMCKLSIPLVLPKFVIGKPKFMIWSLRNVLIEVMKTDGANMDKSLVSSEVATLSCFKLGNVNRSKSKLLNEILNGQHHDTFFHRDCKNGMLNKKLSNGLIETALYLPPTKEMSKSHLNKSMTILNFRGYEESEDAIKKFLLEISNVILVLVNISEIMTADVIKSLNTIASSKKQVILMICKDANTIFNHECKEAIKNCVKNISCENFKSENIILDFTLNGEKNIKELREETIRKISKSLELVTVVKTLESHKDLAYSLDFATDEDYPSCIESKNKVICLIQEIRKSSVDNAKMTFLPLQCKPWQEWAKLNKEEHRLKRKPKGSVGDYIAVLHYKKEEERSEQRQILENPSKLFETFLEVLSKERGDNLHYYLKWIKFYLDSLSREIIPTLNKQYNLKWDETCKFENDDIPDKLREELKQLEAKIAESSFGLEHFMREAGQAYEALADMREDENVSNRIKSVIIGLPRIMANMLLSGYPLELMDGDASHVPSQWVKAVLQELGHIIGKEKKIFVLSVLGIQSSGKSTLLNTMFGFQFAVAAGRCTRGVYAQLVTVCKEYLDVSYDYILVVDTEGLRAPELGSSKLEHDNEIATLVIGLGDLTIVNIKGENAAEMQDVLQIVVHAILKMKLVNKSLKLQPSCLFIHQNVGAPDAAQKMKTGQQKFLETLDKVTKAAGQQEDRPDYCKVKQVIDIDINKNIWYFSDLWKGDPPMAPVNPGYSEKVSQVKQVLFKEIMKQRSYQLTMPKLCMKIEDLWNGILKENFVFSFKNSLEIKAYKALETIRSNLCWSLRNNALKWLNNKSIVLQSQENGLENLKDSLLRECDSHLMEVHNKNEKNLQDFFENNEEKELLEQWKQNSLLKLKDSYEEILSKTKNRLKNAVKIRKMQADQIKDSQRYKKEILSRVVILAKECRDQDNVNTEVLEDKFNHMWNNWVMELSNDCEKDEVNIYENVKNILLNEFNMDQPLLLKSLDKYLFQRIKRNFLSAIEKYISDEPHRKEYKGKRRTTTLKTPGKKLSTENYQDSEKDIRQRTREENYKKAQRYIDEIVTNILSDVGSLDINGFNENYAQSVIRLVKSKLKEMENASVICKATKQLKISFAVYACQLASYKFSSKYKTETEKTKDGTQKYCRIDDIAVHPTFRCVLHKVFKENEDEVAEELKNCCIPLAGNASDFTIVMESHITPEKNLLDRNRMSDGLCLQFAREYVAKLLEKVRTYVEESDLESFKDEYIEGIIKTVADTIKDTEDAKQNFRFTKTFRIEISVYACQCAIPKLHEKHKRYMENVDPRLRFERNYKETYLEMLKKLFKQQGNEKAFADVLAQHLCKAIVNTVDKDMPRKLAHDVRCNVEEVQRKSSFLPAILRKLLEIDTFQEYHLYLTDINSCLDKWISYYVNNHVFKLMKSGKTHYVEIAAAALKNLIATVCREIEKAANKVAQDEAGKASFQLWLKDFQRNISGELPIVENDVASLADGYNIVNLSSFTDSLQSNICAAFEKLLNTFNHHKETHLSTAHEDNVYSLILQECKGCTEKCPFCNAPCSMSDKDHLKQNRNHMAIEHYPLACAGVRWGDDNTLLIENCSVQVAGDEDFENKDTDFQPHPYGKYRHIYPDWEIDGDVSLEASLYWKRFMVKFGSQLAEVYHAEPPEVPQAWRTITIDRVRKSLNRVTAFDSLRESSTC
ncbi:hypothetical protein SK128_010608 [Halocaridina rubra]|uniref:VLIG-type G domain-containing protein n=1 Tax=Halocaridina rubra TaxID=373956 RepID=A0AAN8X5H6_HALRR